MVLIYIVKVQTWTNFNPELSQLNQVSSPEEVSEESPALIDTPAEEEEETPDVVIETPPSPILTEPKPVSDTQKSSDVSEPWKKRVDAERQASREAELRKKDQKAAQKRLQKNGKVPISSYEIPPTEVTRICL
jgi:cytoskeletal protein RodZ